MSLRKQGISYVAGTRTIEVQKDSGTVYALLSGAAKIGQNFGQAYVYETVNANNGGADSFTGEKSYNATFDSAGRIIDRVGVKFFGDGDALDIDEKKLPKPLDDSFSLPEFQLGWDCVGTETLEIKQGTEAHKACEARFKDVEEEDCDKELNYAYSNEVTLKYGDLSESDDDAYGYEQSAEEASNE
mgnify:CR=1 FL=1